jgi:hypothetical protein
MPDEIYKDLKLTAVGCPKDASLPSWQFVSSVLGSQLSDIGMSM